MWVYRSRRAIPRDRRLNSRDAGGKTIVFGLLKRGDYAYTAIVPNASIASLQALIRGRANPDSILQTDGWVGYTGLVHLVYNKHFRVEHRENKLARQLNHTVSF